jgi:hypothetical protein
MVVAGSEGGVMLHVIEWLDLQPIALGMISYPK